MSYARLPLLVTALAPLALVAQISTTSISDFQDGTLQGWQIGRASSTRGPVNTAGGAGGAADLYANLDAPGGGGSGGKLAMFNASAPWTGDYAAAGVAAIRLSVNNTGATTVYLRVGLQGNGNNERLLSAEAVEVAPGSGWTTVTLPVGASDLAVAGFITDKAAILSRVTRLHFWNTQQTSWRSDGAAAEMGFDDIAAVDAGTLPVELVAFSAEASGTGVQLAWMTATERDNRGFRVERAGADGAWGELGFVDGGGTASGAQDYRFADAAPLTGANYYRLRQEDFGGAYAYSPVAAVEVARTGAAPVAYPNPTSGLVRVSGLREARVAVYSSAGQSITTLPVDGESVDLTGLPSGTYLLVAGGAVVGRATVE